MSRGEIAISITEGRTVRDLFYTGLLDILSAAGYQLTIFTEATTVPSFIQEWSRDQIDFRFFQPCISTKKSQRFFYVRRKMVKTGFGPILNSWLAMEQRMVFPLKGDYVRYFQERKPAVMLTTHAHLPAEGELISAAHASNVPTLGIVRSWDNVYKGIRSRPQKLAVWNHINKQELIDLEGYQGKDITVVGSPQFDLYFRPELRWDRRRTASHFNLDPDRPIIVFASLGYFFPGFDETCWMDVLTELINTDCIPGRPQIICRLHPWSRLEHFQKYQDHPDIRLSYVNKYWPALTWYMDDKDMIEMGNMLANCDLVITPGSTVTLEAAIFDRPIIVPVFHPYQMERARNYFSKWVLGKHFKRIQRQNLVPIIDEQEEFMQMIIKCLDEPQYYAPQREQLVKDYVNFTDGRSIERIANVVLSLAGNKSVI